MTTINDSTMKTYQVSQRKYPKNVVYVSGPNLAKAGEHLCLDGYSETRGKDLVCIARFLLPKYEARLAARGWTRKELS